MHYIREPVRAELDTIIVTEKEFQAANNMFKTALHNKYPDLDINDVNYNTVIMTNGLYRVEFQVKVQKDFVD